MNSRAAAPASVGEEKTVEYIKAQMQRIGLKPGNGDSYFQDRADGGNHRRREHRR